AIRLIMVTSTVIWYSVHFGGEYWASYRFGRGLWPESSKSPSPCRFGFTPCQPHSTMFMVTYTADGLLFTAWIRVMLVGTSGGRSSRTSRRLVSPWTRPRLWRVASRLPG